MVLSCTHYLDFQAYLHVFPAFISSEGADIKTFTRSDEFYVESLFIVVENGLFDLPRHLFEPDCGSIALFSPRPREKDGAGWTKDKPITFKGFSRSEFLDFLRYQCRDWKAPKPLQPKKKIPKSKASVSYRDLSYWEPILKVSTVLSFERVREVAIKGITTMFHYVRPVDVLRQVELAREYKVREWLTAAFTTLTKKEATIGDLELGRLGMMTTIRLLRLRDKGFPRDESLEEAINQEADIDLKSLVIENEKSQTIWHKTPPSRGPQPDTTSSSWCFRYIILKVEDILFRFPAPFLTSRSQVFRDMFDLPVANTLEGETEHNPIVLEGVSLPDFNCFMREIWPKSSTISNATPSNKLEYWTAILKHSTMWMFEDVREQAIEKLSVLLAKDGMAMKKLALAKSYDVRKWELEVYLALANRSTVFTKKERQELGAEVILGLLELRDIAVRIQKKTDSGHNDGCYRLSQVTLEEVKKKFSVSRS